MTFLPCGINFLQLHSGVGGFWRISVHKWKLQSHGGALSRKLFIEAFAAAIVIEPMGQQSRLLEPVARHGSPFTNVPSTEKCVPDSNGSTSRCARMAADEAKQAEFAVAFRGNVGEGPKK